MGIAPWGVLGQGLFKTVDELAKIKETGEKTRQARDPKAYEKNRGIVAALQKLAEKKKSNVAGIALAYVYAKEPYVFPILGARKLEQIQGSVEALTNVSLSSEEVKELEESNPLDLGFPYDLIGQTAETNNILHRAAKYSFVAKPQPIQFSN
jgi:aryl-alcohol dehydrogenase-like predicted oxidoreductase